MLCLEEFKKINETLQGELTHQDFNILRGQPEKTIIRGARNGIPYSVEARYKSVGIQTRADIRFNVSVDLNNIYEFKIGDFGLLGFFMRRIRGPKVSAGRLQVEGKDSEAGKRFIERNKQELVQLSELCRPFDFLVLEVEGGKASVHPVKAEWLIPALDLLISIVNSEQKIKD
jgi:hypothetical protein